MSTYATTTDAREIGPALADALTAETGRAWRVDTDVSHYAHGVILTDDDVTVWASTSWDCQPGSMSVRVSYADEHERYTRGIDRGEEFRTTFKLARLDTSPKAVARQIISRVIDASADERQRLADALAASRTRETNLAALLASMPGVTADNRETGTGYFGRVADGHAWGDVSVGTDYARLDVRVSHDQARAILAMLTGDQA